MDFAEFRVPFLLISTKLFLFCNIVFLETDSCVFIVLFFYVCNRITCAFSSRCGLVLVPCRWRGPVWARRTFSAMCAPMSQLSSCVEVRLKLLRVLSELKKNNAASSTDAALLDSMRIPLQMPRFSLWHSAAFWRQSTTRI